MIGAMLGKLVSSSGLGIADKIFGFAVGAAKVFLIFSIIIYVLTSIPMFKSSVEKIFEGSIMYPIFNQVGAQIVKLDPSQIADTSTSIINDAVTVEE